MRTYFRTKIKSIIPIALIVAGVYAGCTPSTTYITENDFYNEDFNSFVEPDFPFFSTYLDARYLGRSFSDDNIVSRGLVINLDDSAFMCFDRDLLRWSVAWTGDRLTASMLPDVSNKDFFNKISHVPQIAGVPAFGTGNFAGWSIGQPAHHEVRSATQKREGFYWGPLPDHIGRWQGVNVNGSQAILNYRISNTRIRELPGVVRWQEHTLFTRALAIGKSEQALFLNAVEVVNGSHSVIEGDIGYIHIRGTDSVVAVGLRHSERVASFIKVIDDRYITIEIPPSASSRQLSVAVWRGMRSELDSFMNGLQQVDTQVPTCEDCGDAKWAQKVVTRGLIASDTAVFVTDILTLPVPNPWKRNVRVTDLAFISEDRMVVTTFEGDVWTVDGVEGDLGHMVWRRFASGLYEPMSIEVVDGQIYVFGKEGIVRLHDLNKDGEADYYENFCDLMQMPPESYAWASDMVFSKTDDSFIIALGAAVNARPGITKPVANGFRAGSNHSGTIMRVSRDGMQVNVIATGFRMPYLGINPIDGGLTATDQQGNYVSATPVFAVGEGTFHGVPATAHRQDNPMAEAPLTWIPHRVDRSAGSQVWITSNEMGPLDGTLIHFSFGRPGLFRVLIDTTARGVQAGVVAVPAKFQTPISKGVIGPADGQLYLAGFNLLGSSSEGVSALQRLRYTGQPSYIASGLRVGSQGIIVSFDVALDKVAATRVENFRVKRWNYRQTDQYGSGHYKLDGTPGEEILPVLSAHLSADSNQVLLIIPGMSKADQMEIQYKLMSAGGQVADDAIWLSVNHTPDLKNYLSSFGDVDLAILNIDLATIASLVKSEEPTTRDRGNELFHTVGCVGCHSAGTETAGKYGPPFKGMYGTSREMSDGTRIIADDAYLRESILDPGKHVVKGFEAAMPSYVGVLSDADIESILLYIMYLKY